MPRNKRKSNKKQGRVSFGARTNSRVAKKRMNKVTYSNGVSGNNYMMKQVRDPQLGLGIRLNFSNSIGNISHITGQTYAWPVSPYWYKAISPDLISQGVASIARTFSYYRFTRLKFTYHPCCPTTTSRTVRLAYCPDSGYASSGESQPSFAAAADFEHNWSFASWEPSTHVISNVPRSRPAFNNKDVTAAVADVRETIQGLLIALVDSDPGATLTVGSVTVDGTVEFFGRTSVLNFTVGRSEYERYQAWLESHPNSIQDQVSGPAQSTTPPSTVGGITAGTSLPTHLMSPPSRDSYGQSLTPSQTLPPARPTVSR